MLFDNRSVYLGASKEKYEQYCKALEAERMGGNSGTDKTLYEILVGGKDYDNAMGILKALK